MDPSERLDALLRDQLHRADTLLVEPRLEAVLARSAQRRRRRRAGWVAAAVLVLVAGSGAIVGLLQGRSPAQTHAATGSVLDGRWTRTTHDGVWVISFDTHRTLSLQVPSTVPAASFPVDGASYATDGDTVRIAAFVNGDCYTLPVGTYHWTRSGGVLRLQAVADPCSTRRELFAGTWVRDE